MLAACDESGSLVSTETAVVVVQVITFALTVRSADSAFVINLRSGAYSVVGFSVDGSNSWVMPVDRYAMPLFLWN